MPTPHPRDDLSPPLPSDVHTPRPRGRPPKNRLPPSANALRHGVLSASPVIPEIENEADWQAHLAGQIAALKPEGDLELALASRIALDPWRLNRLIVFERRALRPSQLEIDHRKSIGSLVDGDGVHLEDRHLPASSIEPVQRYEAHLHRIFLKDLHELEALQTRRRGDPTPLARVEIN